LVLLIDILRFISDAVDFIAQASQSDNNKDNAVKSSYENSPYMNPLSGILFAVCIVVSAVIWFEWNYASQPSNATSIEDSDNLFPSGSWVSRYFQYKRWHGPHTFSLSFDHQKFKVAGCGTDDVGTFSIDGIYSLTTHRIDLTKKYQEKTGNPSENLGHTVAIQLEWNFKERQFDGEWHVQTKKYHGKDKFDRSTVIANKS
jgi:hypothetical protein